MTFYVQHGYGKGQKIPAVHGDGNLGGVVLSPGDEDPANLGDTARYCRQADLEVLVDPQTYLYSTQPAGRGRNHQAHELAFDGLSWAQDAQSVAAHIDRIGRLNDAVNSDGLWIAPGPLQDSFADLWTPLSVQFARTASQSWGQNRTIATLAVDEAGLSDWLAIERWLDVATALPVRGFYVLVSRPSTAYPNTPWAPAKLANLLRLIHALSELNDFDVTWGYSDFEGLLGLAAGATAMATGWSYTLRQFSSSKWMSPASGGRAPAVRTNLARLWSLPRAETETAPLFASSLRDAIFTADEIARYSTTPFDSLGRVDAQIDHMNALAARASWLSSQTDPSSRVGTVAGSLESAVALWDSIASAGMLPDPSYRNRVVALRDGLRLFTDQVAL
ncbi:hypothetical protein [Microbacterium sp. PA5]|uniref:hypothetical protein n=1 Tax=Microbacterium sp. PA5 TaxID=3416654 RepID=UPI003CF70C4F